MEKIYYNKLVRDNVPDKIRALGAETEVYEMVNDEEYLQELRKKLQEESLELSTSMSKKTVAEEIGDLMIVVDNFLEAMELTAEDIEQAKKKSIASKGSFSKRLFMTWSSDSGYEARKKAQQ
ncbi:MAG: nucleoside triphosphate pyrophosphohydrolase [Candidatus Magasanikbacteria bacterium]|jgi:predicted house-cleaning noncanonical NTP pyrophosphatase (MazG superfamily)|nr:nucleoside triphosphate pyrophosphohydrolase [Candidatus Magasanikbacteria bacterium]